MDAGAMSVEDEDAKEEEYCQQFCGLEDLDAETDIVDKICSFLPLASLLSLACSSLRQT